MSRQIRPAPDEAFTPPQPPDADVANDDDLDDFDETDLAAIIPFVQGLDADRLRSLVLALATDLPEVRDVLLGFVTF